MGEKENVYTLLVVSSKQLAEFADVMFKKCMAKQEQAQNEDVWLSAKQAADMLGVTKSTLWRWSKEHYLVPTKRGTRNVYKKSQIRKLMEGRV